MQYREITTPNWTKSEVEPFDWQYSPRIGFKVSWSSDYGYIVMAEKVKQNGFATVLPIDGRMIEKSIRQIIKQKD
mgnify:FL=1